VFNFRSDRLSIIGMVHLRALPGAPAFEGDLGVVERLAVADAQALYAGGVDAIIMENFGDAPFTKGKVSAITIAAMTRCALSIRRETSVPLGINVLRNDAIAALEIAHVVGAEFIRVNVLTGARVTDQGVVEGDAYGLTRRRAELGARSIQIWADVDVKHSAPLAERPFDEEVKETVGRGLADVICVSGAGTGSSVNLARLRDAVAASTVPVVLGSGVSVKNVRSFAAAQGAIVGSSLKLQGLDSPVAVEKVRALLAAAVW
jgi:hypothetical protein